MITFDDFKKLEIITARVVNVRNHPDADKLFILEVDTGTGKKEIVAGIRNFYAKDELIGKDIVMVDNLSPATIRGVESNGMLLAATSENVIVIVVPDKPSKPGSKVR